MQEHGQKDGESITQSAPTNQGGHIGTREIRPLDLLSQALKPTDLIETMTQKVGDPLNRYRDEEGEVIPSKVPLKYYIAAAVHEIIEAAKRLNLGLCVRHGAIYGYTGTHWQEIPDEELKKMLAKMALKVGFGSRMEARTPKFREDIFKQFMGDALENAPEPDRGGKTLINLRNGTLEISEGTVKLREHRPEDFLTYCLEYDYRPHAEAPLFTGYLNRVLPEKESRMIAQEFLGYAFTTGLKLEKVLVLYGSGGNGKSVFFEVVTAAFGKENIAHKGLGELCQKGDRGNGHRAEVENRLLNYSSELNPAGADIDIFKTIVSGEPVTARRLYKDPFTYRPTVKMIFNANKLPAETERTDAYFRRFLIVPFDVTIPKEEIDVKLPQKIIDRELPGVLNWIIEGLQRITRQERFTDSSKAAEALQAYKEESNSVAQFVKEYTLRPNPDEFLPNRELYRSYTEFCNEAGYKRLSQVNFGKEMKALGFEADNRRINGKRSRGFKAEFGA
jgi:putative DNA primase/helicase